MDKKTENLLIKGGIGLGVGIVGLFAFNKIRNRQREKAAAKAIVTGGSKELGINVPDIAKQIGLDLGTAYPSYDPRSWTENDEAVKLLVLKVPKPYIPQLKKYYTQFYPGRDLESDLRKMLDDYDEVKYLFVS